MDITINVWNEERRRWDECKGSITRVTKTQLIVDLNEESLRFYRHSGLLHGLACNKDKERPNHTAPFIDAVELKRTSNLAQTNKPLYQRL